MQLKQNNKLQRFSYLVNINRYNRGFSLIEMAVVLVIVGALLGGVLSARSIIRNAQTQDRIKSLNDIVAATHHFKEKFGMWPGDFTNATASISGLVCANGNGNGQINTAAETTCATESLIRSGLLRGDAALPISVGETQFSLTSPALSGVAGLPGHWVNVVSVQNLNCDSAIQIDRSVDDGNVNTGNFRIANLCPGQDDAVIVANAVLKIN